MAEPRYAAIFKAIRSLTGTVASSQTPENRTDNQLSHKEAGPTLDGIVDYIMGDNGLHSILGGTPRPKVRADVREKLITSSFGGNSWGYTLPVHCAERCAGITAGHYVLTEEGVEWLEQRLRANSNGT